MNITFWGATEDVTGSMSIVESDGECLLIDCGLAQGPKEVEAFNDTAFPVRPEDITAVILTHAHLDHSGRLPQLVRGGFSGKIFGSQATLEIARIILKDSASIDHGKYYDLKDVEKTFHLFHVLPMMSEEKIFKDITVTLRPAGHILGATSVVIKRNGKTVVFSGDLGRFDDALLPPPLPCPPADVVVMESTYGGKKRKGDMHAELSALLRRVKGEERILVVASFAVARAQNLLLLMHEHFHQYPEERVPLLIDSPMMEHVNKVYRRFSDLTHESRELQFTLSEAKSILSKRMWESVANKNGPLVILASSGMLTGGRVWRHLENWQNDEKAILFLPGYQSPGTPGDIILHRRDMMIRPDGRPFQWKGEVVHSDAFSSHADSDELQNWVSQVSNETKIFLNHGEEGAKKQLEKNLKSAGHANVEIPARGTTITI